MRQIKELLFLLEGLILFVRRGRQKPNFHSCNTLLHTLKPPLQRHTLMLSRRSAHTCVGPDWLPAPLRRQSALSGWLHPASSQMFCGLLCKPTCICLLAFQNVWYHCIHYGLSSWPPAPHVLLAGISVFSKEKPAFLRLSPVFVERFYFSFLAWFLREEKFIFGY